MLAYRSHFARIFRVALAAVVAVLLTPASVVLAQTKPPSSTDGAARFAGGGATGDPRGAVRALGSVQGAGAKAHDKGVSVPRMGGEEPNKTRGVPLGTTR